MTMYIRLHATRSQFPYLTIHSCRNLNVRNPPESFFHPDTQVFADTRKSNHLPFPSIQPTLLPSTSHKPCHGDTILLVIGQTKFSSAIICMKRKIEVTRLIPINIREWLRISIVHSRYPDKSYFTPPKISISVPCTNMHTTRSMGGQHQKEEGMDTYSHRSVSPAARLIGLYSCRARDFSSAEDCPRNRPSADFSCLSTLVRPRRRRRVGCLTPRLLRAVPSERDLRGESGGCWKCR